MSLWLSRNWACRGERHQQMDGYSAEKGAPSKKASPRASDIPTLQVAVQHRDEERDLKSVDHEIPEFDSPTSQTPGDTDMAKGEQRSNRETKKPKKEKIKTIAAAPSQKTGNWQPNLGSGKKK